MVSLLLGNYSSRVLVGDPSCPSLIDCGQIVDKKRLDLQLKADCMALNSEKIKPLHIMLRREKLREESIMARKTKVKYQVPFQNKRQRRICHISNPSNVRSTFTMPNLVVVQRRENTNPKLLMLIKILHIRSQGMMIMKCRRSSKGFF